MDRIKVSVESIATILKKGSLNIPGYQRPYKWERRHIRNLFYDTREAISKTVSEYRIGSIIVHDNKDKLDIVDGQQRLISISLLLYHLRRNDIGGRFAGAKKLLEFRNYTDISRKHAKDNFEEWVSLCQLISKKKLSEIEDYIINKCKMFVITIPKADLAQAFQLFDSQNNRGKALEPHDLLKAYHLRSIKNPKEGMIEKWESLIAPKDADLTLKDLFDKHLFRIRRWVNGNTGLNKKRYGSELRFSERFIDDFKGVDLESGDYPYLRLYKKLSENNIEFPNSLTMPIINGEAFFNYISYSYSCFEKGIAPYTFDKSGEYLNSSKRKFSRNNNLYFNLMSLFVDRFGDDSYNNMKTEINEKIFVWAYYPRAIAKSIYDSTIANYAGNGTFRRQSIYQKMFQLLAASSTPRDFIAKIDMDILDNLTVDSIIDKMENE